MAELCRIHGVSALYVTHDLAVVANIADRVAVMYAGQIVELGPRDTIFANPSHPYTRALLDSIPHLSQARALTGIPGRTPAPGARPSGCRFNDRCSFAIDECRAAVPELATIATEHDVRCIRVARDRDVGHLPRHRARTPTPTRRARSSSRSRGSTCSTAASTSCTT